MFAYCNDNPVNYKDSEGTEPELAMGWAASMSWLPAIDGPVPVGDTIYILIFLALCVPYFSKNESKLPNQGPVSEIPDAPQLILVNKESMYQVIPTTIHPNRSGKRARPVFVKHRKPGKTGRKSNLMEACVLGQPVMDEK